jgi:hypothetical protein
MCKGHCIRQLWAFFAKFGRRKTGWKTMNEKMRQAFEKAGFKLGRVTHTGEPLFLRKWETQDVLPLDLSIEACLKTMEEFQRAYDKIMLTRREARQALFTRQEAADSQDDRVRKPDYSS